MWRLCGACWSLVLHTIGCICLLEWPWPASHAHLHALWVMLCCCLACPQMYPPTKHAVAPSHLRMSCSSKWIRVAYYQIECCMPLVALVWVGAEPGPTPVTLCWVLPHKCSHTPTNQAHKPQPTPNQAHTSTHKAPKNHARALGREAPLKHASSGACSCCHHCCV